MTFKGEYGYGEMMPYSAPKYSIQELSVSGLFRYIEMHPKDKTPVFSVGVIRDIKEGVFIASSLSDIGSKSGIIHKFEASQDGLIEWDRWIKSLWVYTAKNVICKVCADFSFISFLIAGGYLEEALVPNLWPNCGNATTLVLEEDKHDLNNRETAIRLFQFRPILAEMVIAYLTIIHNETPTPSIVAKFLASVASESMTYNFLTLYGMAPSAQDLIFVSKSTIQNMTSVISCISGGAEIFDYGRTEMTPREINPVQFGIDYFSTKSFYKNLPEPYRVKLAFINICKKYAMKIGYSVIWNEGSKGT